MCGIKSDRMWRHLLAVSAQSGQPASAAEALQPANESEQFLSELYGRFAAAGADQPYVVAHLGQSIDGFVATDSGDSYYVTGPANLDHLHRMRALADAVVVGAGTVAADDPALTTRRVSGPNPVRVVLDGRLRLSASHKVFNDGAAATLLVCASGHAASAQHGDAEILALSSAGSRISTAVIIAALIDRGLSKIFVEGGGDVASSFLTDGALHQLQLTVAPVMIGSGKRGIAAPAQDRLRDCLRPPHRLFRMGDDVLFDYDLRSSAVAESGKDGLPSLMR